MIVTYIYIVYIMYCYINGAVCVLLLNHINLRWERVPLTNHRGEELTRNAMRLYSGYTPPNNDNTDIRGTWT